MNGELDEISLQKSASIRRCVQRAREEKNAAGQEFRNNFTRQDACLLNVFRACETAIDLANHLVRVHGLGVPAWSDQAFEMLSRADLIPLEMGDRLAKMVRFRNLAIHEYDRLDLDLVEANFEGPLDDLIRFADADFTKADGVGNS